MKTIVITGLMGAGKSLFISLLKKRGLAVFISDRAVDPLLKPDSPCYPQLKKLFPDKKFYHAEGSFNKKQIAKLLFTDKNLKKKMESLIHPLVRKSFQNFAENQKKRGFEKVFYEIPLISTDFLKSFDCSVLITCPLEVRKQRLLKAGWEILDIQKRWASQISDSQLKNQVDFIINNSGTIKNLEEQIPPLLEGLK